MLEGRPILKPSGSVRVQSITIGAAVNREDVLRENLKASPCVADHRALLLIESGHRSASIAYNRLIDRCQTGVLVLAHQDVYLPRGWDVGLVRAIERIESLGKPWGVLGVIGKSADGTLLGAVWSNGLQSHIGTRSNDMQSAVSIDEMIIVLNLRAGLRFDEHLPGFHLYGTDIVQECHRTGHDAYVLSLPAVHNSVPVVELDPSYVAAYRHMQQKWDSVLPIPTCVLPITRMGWPLRRYLVRARMRRWLRGIPVRPVNRSESGPKLATRVGLE